MNKDQDGQSSKEDMQMRKPSISLSIREVQIKTQDDAITYLLKQLL